MQSVTFKSRIKKKKEYFLHLHSASHAQELRLAFLLQRYQEVLAKVSVEL